MKDLQEFRTHWKALTAASLGLAVGYSFINYVTNIFAPRLIGDFGWSKSDFALLGFMVMVAVICQPIAGKLADAFGVRRIALVGVVCGPVLFLLLSNMNGQFWQFYLINVVQVILVGGTTGPVIYTRLVAERFHVSRGAALGIASCAPALAGVACAPLLAQIVASYGWRTAYIFVACFVSVVGLLTISIIPARRTDSTTRSIVRLYPEAGYKFLFRKPAFLLIVTGVFLCNLTLTLQISQLGILLSTKGVSAITASYMISLYAAGIIFGRLVCGIALDHFPPHLVSTITMSAPAIGLLLLASGISTTVPLALAVAILGLSFGAEGDVGAYLVMKYFRKEIYGSVFGLVMGALSLSGAIGALLLSFTLKLTETYTLFLFIGAVAAICGGILFLLLGKLEVPSTGNKNPVHVG